MILCVETATNAFSLTVFDGREYHEVETLYQTAYSQNVVAEAKSLLERIGKNIADVTEAYADIGPGSFTGLRIGAAIAKALCFEGKPKLISVPTLSALANSAIKYSVNITAEKIIAAVPSHKNLIY